MTAMGRILGAGVGALSLLAASATPGFTQAAEPPAAANTPPAEAEPAAAALPTQASARQPAATTPISGALADARLAEVRERVEAATHSAAEAGLPAEWLLDKVAEGLAKGVPPGQIVSAVEHLGERMRAAARIQHGLPPARDRAQARATLRALVDALGIGAPEAAVARLSHGVARSDPDAVRAGIDTVADLGERGFRGEAAVHAVEVAFERGGRDGMTGLLASADAIGGKGDAARMQALTAAANRTMRPSALPSAMQGRERAMPVRPVGPVHDRGAARAAPASAAHPTPARPGRSPK